MSAWIRPSACRSSGGPRVLASVLGYLAAVLTAAAAVVKMLGARGTQPSATRRYLIAALATIGVALAGTAPATLRAASVVEPFPHAAQLLANSFAMTGAFCVHGVLAHSVADRWTRRTLALHAGVLMLCMAVMTFVLAARAHQSAQPVPGATSGLDPAMEAMVAYMAIYVGYIGWSCCRFVWLIHRYARPGAAPSIMRRSLRLTVTAAMLGLAWVGWKIAGIVALLTAGRTLPYQDDIAAAAGVGAAVSGCVGATVTSWWPALRNAPAQWAMWRAYRTLSPLWSRLIAAVPEVRLPDTVELPGADRGEYRLYRRVIEIRDAQLTLCGRIPAHVRVWVVTAAGAGDQHDTGVMVQAAELAVALEVQGKGESPTATGQAPTVPSQLAEAGVLAEAAALSRISLALQDPVVATVREHARRYSQTSTH